MKLQEKLLRIFLEKTLYHGTVADNKEDILKYGLIPQVGTWVKDAYGHEYDFDSDMFDNNFDDPEEYWGVVFAGDKKGISAALGGIRYHVGKKLGKDLTDVTIDDIARHGLLVIINDDDEYPDFIHKPDGDSRAEEKHDREYSPPPSVEPGDFWTRKSIRPKQVIEGNALIRFLRRYGAFNDEHLDSFKKDPKLQNIQKGQKKAREIATKEGTDAYETAMEMIEIDGLDEAIEKAEEYSHKYRNDFWNSVVTILYKKKKHSLNESNYTIIYRALPFNSEDIFRKDDYVTKKEKFAIEHAETSSIFNGEHYKVIKAMIKETDIRNASNPGEYLMNQDIIGNAVWKLVLDDNTQTVERVRL